LGRRETFLGIGKNLLGRGKNLLGNGKVLPGRRENFLEKIPYLLEGG
jgi:hypothetical protein